MARTGRGARQADARAAGEPTHGTERAFGAHTAEDSAASGVGAAAKAVAEDVSALVRAEIDLAKAELAAGAKAKAAGAGMMAGTAVLAWLGLQALVIAAGFALALVMPGWAAALVVAVVLFLIGVVLALVARSLLSKPVGVTIAREQAQADMQMAKDRLRLARTRSQVQEDVEWTKSRLTRR